MARCWYWYTFADGYQTCVRGMDRVELAWEEKYHGKLVNRRMVIA